METILIMHLWHLSTKLTNNYPIPVPAIFRNIGESPLEPSPVYNSSLNLNFKLQILEVPKIDGTFQVRKARVISKSVIYLPYFLDLNTLLAKKITQYSFYTNCGL